MKTVSQWKKWASALASQEIPLKGQAGWDDSSITRTNAPLFAHLFGELEKQLRSPGSLVRPLRVLFVSNQWNPLRAWLSQRPNTVVEKRNLEESPLSKENSSEPEEPFDLLVWWDPILTEETTPFADSLLRWVLPQGKVFLAFPKLTKCFALDSLLSVLQSSLPNLSSPFHEWRDEEEAKNAGVWVSNARSLQRSGRGSACLLQASVVSSFRPTQPWRPYENKDRIRTKHFLSRLEKGPTYEELCLLPSRREPGAASELTAVVTVFRKDPAFLKNQLESLLSQSAPPEEIWVCAWASPREAEYRDIVSSFRSRFARLYWFSSDFPLKYFGRFQIALQARTKYTVFLDDDVNPGEEFFELCLHTIQTSTYRGLLSVKGWQLPATRSDESLPSHLEGGVWVPTPSPPEGWVEHLTEMDMVGGLWFLETDWLRHCFREAPLTWETAEDFHFSYALRKYAGLRSFLLPMDKENPATWGLSAQYDLMSSDQPTTLGDAHILRDAVSRHLLGRGNALQWMRARSARDGILAVCDTKPDFSSLQIVLESLAGVVPLAVASTGRDLALERELQEEEFSAEWLPPTHRFCLRVFRGEEPEPSEGELLSRWCLEISTLLETFSPRVLLVPGSLRRWFPIIRILTKETDIQVFHWTTDRNRSRTHVASARFGSQKQKATGTELANGGFETISRERLTKLWEVLPPLRRGKEGGS